MCCSPFVPSFTFTANPSLIIREIKNFERSTRKQGSEKSCSKKNKVGFVPQAWPRWLGLSEDVLEGNELFGDVSYYNFNMNRSS